MLVSKKFLRINKLVNSSRGFTMMELLISISIMGVIFSIGFAGYRGSNSRYAQLRSAQTIAQAIRDAQNMALSGRILNCTGPPAGKPCKYGLHAELASPSELIVFGDGTNGKTKNDKYDVGEQIKVYKPEENVFITQIFIGGTSKSEVNIVIEPPNPVIDFHPSSGDDAKIVITGGRSISVTAGGSVDVD